MSSKKKKWNCGHTQEAIEENDRYVEVLAKAGYEAYWWAEDIKYSGAEERDKAPWRRVVNAILLADRKYERKKNGA